MRTCLSVKLRPGGVDYFYSATSRRYRGATWSIFAPPRTCALGEGPEGSCQDSVAPSDWSSMFERPGIRPLFLLVMGKLSAIAPSEIFACSASGSSV